MKDKDLLRMWTSGAGRHYEIPILDTLRAIARAAAEDEREACALLCEIESEDYDHQGPRLACRALAKLIRSHASEDR